MRNQRRILNRSDSTTSIFKKANFFQQGKCETEGENWL